MIPEFVVAWEARKSEIEESFRTKHPGGYEDIVKQVVSILGDTCKYDSPDPNRVVIVDHGDYQGTLLFVIGAKGYQPNDYWYVKVSYGSCSVCDTYEAIRYSNGAWESDVPNEQQVKDYMTEALHVIQGLRAMQ